MAAAELALLANTVRAVDALGLADEAALLDGALAVAGAAVGRGHGVGVATVGQGLQLGVLLLDAAVGGMLAQAALFK